MRKIFYKFGAIALVATPIIATVSCGKSNKEQTTLDELNVNVNTISDVTIDVRIPDFTKITKFDEKTFDASKFIKLWETKVERANGVRSRTEVAEMIPYSVDRKIVIAKTSTVTLGGLMDEINKVDDIFKFNMDLKDAGEMGRFLWGIKKSEKALETVRDLQHDSWWPKIWKQNDQGDWVTGSDESQSYISISSPNAKQADQNSHAGFDKNESFLAFDGRLPKGIDNIKLSSHEIYDLNLWKVVNL